jgi:hypothetical protein
MPSLYSNIRNIANSYFDSLSTHGTLADCYSQSIDSIPENVTYLYGDDDLESTKGPWLQVNSINERLRIVDIAPSKTPKALRDRYIKDLSLIQLRTGLDLERVSYLR